MIQTAGAHGARVQARLPLRDVAFSAGFALAAFMAIDILLGAALLVAGVAISPVLAPASAVLACAVSASALRGDVPARRIAAGFGVAAVVVVVAVALGFALYDTSYDGNSYQKSVIGALAYGWNPVWESIESYWSRAPLSLPPISHALWADCYPKATGIFGASIYVVTGSIETAKSINLIAAAALACLAFDYLAQRILTPARAAVCAVLLAINPISLPQMFTNYVDGLLSSVLIALIVALAAQADPAYDRRDAAPWGLVAALIAVCVNIKFTGFVYAGFFCAAYWVLEIGRAAAAGGFASARRAFLHRTGYYLAVVGVSVLIAGSNTYVVNTVRHGSPFYPLISSQTVDIIKGYQPDSFEDMNPYAQWGRSLFSKTENLWKDPVNLKVPFTVDTDELSVDAPDTRRAGFGAFFSGAFVVSLGVAAVALVRFWRTDRVLFANAIAFAVPSLLLIGMTDGSWWARYTPYLWALPVCAVAALLACGAGGARAASAVRVAGGSHAAGDGSVAGGARAAGGSSVAGGARVVSTVAGVLLACVLVADVATFAPTVRSAAYGAQQMRALTETALAHGGAVEAYQADAGLCGILYNLWDAGVDYTYTTQQPQGDPVASLSYAGLQLY